MASTVTSPVSNLTNNVATTSIAGLGTISSTGIGSGLNVSSIISSLVSIDQLPLTQLQNRVTSYQAEISAYGALQGVLSGLQTATQSLSTANSFQNLTASVGDGSSATATAGSNASVANHTLNVQTLAQAQNLASADFAGTGTVIGTGTLTFQFGTYASASNTFTPNTSSGTKSVAIDSAHSTLAGVRDAINAANVGVSASIINDGTGNKLVVSSINSGAANSLKISVADADGNNTDNSGLSQLAYDPTATGGTPAGFGSGKNLSQTVAAQDATLTIDGITVTSASNTLSTALQGVTLNLLKAGSGPTSLNVTQNSAALQGAAQSFVSTYNSVVTTIQSLTAFDSSTKSSSPLTGDATTLRVQSSLTRALNQTVTLPDGTSASLADIGVSFQVDGTLALDSTKLHTAIATKPNLVEQLFAATGSATDSSVSYIGSSIKTQAGTYSLGVSQLATQGSLTGGASAGLNVTSGVNDSFNLTLDGVTSAVNVVAGTYGSASALAAAVQSAINGSAAFGAAGNSAVVTADGSGILHLTSSSFGSKSAASIDASAGALNLFGIGSTSANGVDVAGSINGVAAVGTGQTLKGASGSSADGLQFQVAGGSIGQRGTVSYSQGYAYQLTQLLNTYLGTTGVIAGATTGLNSTITSLQKQENEVNARVAADQTRYQAEFTALDKIMTSLNGISSYLTQQLTNLPVIGAPSKTG